MTPDELKKRTKVFAHRCVKLATSLPKGALSVVCERQLIKASTSVAANYRAVCLAQSKATFISKMSIVIEECDESYFWIEFIQDEGLVKKNKVTALLKEASALTMIFISSRMTSSDKRKNN